MKKLFTLHVLLFSKKLIYIFFLIFFGFSQVYASDNKIEGEREQLLLETDQLLEAVEENILTYLKQEKIKAEHENQTKIETTTGNAVIESPLLAERRAVEAKRKYLYEKINKWRRFNAETIDSLSVEELNTAMSEARAIAEYYGLDVDKLGKLYELGKKTIKNSEFAIPERIPPDKDESYSTYFRSFFTFAHNREKELSEFRAKTQEYRVRLFKKVTLTYIGALLSSGEKFPECKADKAQLKLIINGTTIQALGCPDPVVDNLRRYVKAIQLIASAESDIFTVEAELVLARQTLVGDMAAGLPLVGDAIDWYSLYSGQDLAGKCLSRLSYGITAVFAAIPFLPKSWGEQALKRGGEVFTSVGGKIAGFGETFLKKNPTVNDGLSRLLILASTYSKLSSEMVEGIALRIGSTPEKLDELAKILYVDLNPITSSFNRVRHSSGSVDQVGSILTADVRLSGKGIELDLGPALGGKISKATQTNMTRKLSSEEIVYRNIQMAQEGQLIMRNIPKELRKRMEARTRRIMNANLDAIQGSKKQIIEASNMVPEHVLEFEKLARDKDAVLIFRAVNADATDLIKANYGTKWMDVKPKSSDWGPHKGFLPYEQKFSKIGNPDAIAGLTPGKRTKVFGEIEKYSEHARKCLSKNGCFKMELELPDGNTVHIWKKGDDEIPIIRNKAGQYLHPRTEEILEVANDSVRPMEVMAGKNAKGEIVPLTADYDLAAMGTRSDVQIPKNSDKTGLITEEEEMLINEINLAGKKAGYTGGNLSHHGAESRHAGSEGALAQDPVMTVVHPQKGLKTIPRCDAKCMKKWCDTPGLNLCGGMPLCNQKNTNIPCMVIDPDRLLKDFMHEARLDGYTNLHPNSVWEWGEVNGLSGWTPKVLLDSKELIDESGEKIVKENFGQYQPGRGVVNTNKKIKLRGVAKAAALKATKYLFSCPGEVTRK